jgi:hypothetical protein
MPMPLNIGTGRALLGGQQRGPVLWLRRGVDQFTDVAATAPANTGDAVAAWRDRDIIASQATAGARPTRQAGGELSFDRTKRLDITDGGSLASNASGFTVAAWALFVDVPASTIFGRGSLNTADYALFMDTLGRLRFNLYQPAIDTIDLTHTVVFGKWYFVVGSLVNGIPRLYRDGAFVAEGLPFVRSGTVIGPTVVGSVDWGSPHNGSIGDIRIWHRALSADEIAALFAAERGLYGV